MMSLLQVWNDCCNKYCNNQELIQSFWEEITVAYSQSNRHYHNLKHLETMMSWIEENGHLLEKPDIMKMSVFYHDLIYDAQSQQNELKSAEIAKDRLAQLGFSGLEITQCYNLIIATQKHQASGDSDTQFFLDLDLMTLGSSPEEYLKYAQNIRREFDCYTDEIFNNGRSKVLKHFLEKPNIYQTKYFQEKLEAQATSNLKLELAQLQSKLK